MVSVITEALESLKANFDRAEKITRELSTLSVSYRTARVEEKAMIEKSILALISQLEIINEPVEALVQSIVVEVPKARKVRKVERKYERITTATGPVYITKESKEKFLEDLGIEKKSSQES